MSVNRYIISILCVLISFCVQAQEMNKLKSVNADTLANKVTELRNGMYKSDSLKTSTFKPDPTKVVWMAAILPVYGQIMNRKYWKLPIVYGGFLGCAYAVTWNSTTYQSYLTAYRDIIDTDPTTNSFLQIIPKGRTIDSYGGISVFTSTLKSKQDVYRRYRDLSIIATVGFYALTIVDAFVDAQLYDFDISPDLSLRLQPGLLNYEFGKPATLGLQCCINFK